MTWHYLGQEANCNKKKKHTQDHVQSNRLPPRTAVTSANILNWHQPKQFVEEEAEDLLKEDGEDQAKDQLVSQGHHSVPQQWRQQ